MYKIKERNRKEKMILSEKKDKQTYESWKAM
jgi:hypothetical protein